MNKTEQYIESADGSFHHVPNIKKMSIRQESGESCVVEADFYDDSTADLTKFLNSYSCGIDALNEIVLRIASGDKIINFDYQITKF